MTTPKELFATLNTDGKFADTGQLMLPKGATALITLPSDDSHFASTIIHRVDDNMPDQVRAFYMSVFAALLDILVEDMDMLVDRSNSRSLIDTLTVDAVEKNKDGPLTLEDMEVKGRA